MFCSKCGEKIPDDSTFCPFCRNPVTKEEPSLSSSSQSVPLGREVSAGMHIGIIVGTLFIPLIGLIMGIIYLKSPSLAKKKAGKIWLWVAIGAFIINLFIYMQ